MEWINIRDRQPAKDEIVWTLSKWKYIEPGVYDSHCFRELVDARGQILFAQYWTPFNNIPLPYKSE